MGLQRSSGLERGASVRLKGLHKSPRLNNSLGIIVSDTKDPRGRWHVELTTTLPLKPEHLKLKRNTICKSFPESTFPTSTSSASVITMNACPAAGAAKAAATAASKAARKAE